MGNYLTTVSAHISHTNADIRVTKSHEPGTYVIRINEVLIFADEKQADDIASKIIKCVTEGDQNEIN